MTYDNDTAYDDGEYAARCPACGDPIDYCQGHGEIGDADGYGILEAHDTDNHAWCHIDGCEYAPSPSPFSYDGERRARVVFRKRYNGAPNVLTPHVLRYDTTPHYAVEISRGDGIGGGVLYGVTVLTHDGARTEHSRCYDVLSDATRYVETLRRYVPTAVTS